MLYALYCLYCYLDLKKGDFFLSDTSSNFGMVSFLHSGYWEAHQLLEIRESW